MSSHLSHLRVSTSRLVLPSLWLHNTASISPSLGPISSWKSGYCSSYQLLHMIYPKPGELKWPFIISQSSARWLRRTDFICGFLGSSCVNPPEAWHLLMLLASRHSTGRCLLEIPPSPVSFLHILIVRWSWPLAVSIGQLISKAKAAMFMNWP